MPGSCRGSPPLLLHDVVTLPAVTLRVAHTVCNLAQQVNLVCDCDCNQVCPWVGVHDVCTCVSICVQGTDRDAA